MGSSLLPLIERAAPVPARDSGGGSDGSDGDGSDGGSSGVARGLVNKSGSTAEVVDACATAEELVRQAAEQRGAARARVLCDAVEQLADAWRALQQLGARGAAALPELLGQLRAVLTMKLAD